MRKTLMAVAAAGTATFAFTGLSAQEGASQLPGQVDPSRVTAGTYSTDPSHTLVGWNVDHFGFNDYFGIFGDIEGTLEIDPANLSDASVDITIPIASVVTASEGLTEHLLRAASEGGSPDFFGADPEPARFVSTMVHRIDETSAHIMGNLTFNGVTNPVTIEAEFTGAGSNPFSGAETIGFEGTATINRSDWGMNYAVPLVSDEVELDISVAFEKN